MPTFLMVMSFLIVISAPHGILSMPHVAPAVAPTPTHAFATQPPAAMFPGDSADSLYRVARKALNDGDYRRAATLFRQIAEDYPSSRYAGDALYWQAFSLYRRGGNGDLHSALDALEAQRSKYPSAATHGDAAALSTRINGELARRGDSGAGAYVAQTAAGATKGCPNEDDDMRVAALNALMQMDAQEALPVLRKVLARRDACSEALRKKAVFIVAQKEDTESADILLSVARSDPSNDVRESAVFWLGQVSGERSVSLLDSILTSTKDENLQDKAIFALSQHGGERAGKILRDLITQPNTSDDVKSRAIFALGHYRGDASDFAYLRDVFPKLDKPELREQVIQSMAQSDDPDNRRWLLGVAEDPHQDVEIRKKALFWAGQGGVPIADLSSMYDRMTDDALKEQVIFVLSQREEREATDKLIDIARHDHNIELRKKAIFWLGQRDDPRVRKLLEELITNDSI
ncbi:MAG TPA: HEAT repeat domain-containing protein [Gemmatimonadaceae bacterium]|nr:HEAT repeat domain-containing protein [Gemmatimonadaceae bacterium]